MSKFGNYEPVDGKPLRILIFYITHPLRMLTEKPVLAVLVAAPAVFYVGVWQGWWPNFIANLPIFNG